MIGQILNGRYQLDTTIGQGGMSVIYGAHDTLLERRVAVKVLSEAGLDTEARSLLLREARSAARLNHPNIASVYDAGEVAGMPYIVMELVEGPSLYDQRPDTLEEVLSVARQVCAALEHAHVQGIVHRDLKPENVLLAPDGRAKLVDFGLARPVASRLTGKDTLSGTVFYLAPELALGQEVDGRADLYALGVMLYEMATGRLPFLADDPLAVITQHLHAPVIPPRARCAQFPAALDALIVRLLSKDPGERPASAAKVLQLLDAPEILDREAVPTKQPSMLERIERGRMVGRETELQATKAIWERVLAGEGQTLLISGEPGIGKTRLVRELATQVQVSGGRALLGACYVEGGAPYAPFAQIVRGVLEHEPAGKLELPDSVLADLLTVAPTLRLRYSGVKPNPPLDDPKAEQHRLRDSFLILVTALGDQAPLLLVLEDAHWADSGTLSLLRHLARTTSWQPVLIVATYRDVELDEALPLHKVLLDLGREHLATRLKLTRLDREQTRELLAVLFAEEITDEFLDGVWRETEGNPFFIEEVCKALVESGKLFYHDGHWDRPSMEELGIPQSVRVAIQARVRALPAAAQEILHLAAALGREFDLDTLIAASAIDEEAVMDAVDHARRAQLLEEEGREGKTVFSFIHALVPATLIESLRLVQRRQLHRQAATAIEARRPDDYEALAYHYNEAGQAELATNYLLRAGDRARSLYACQEAIDYYQQALAYLKELEEGEQAARTLMKLGLVYTAMFQPDRAQAAYREAFALWEPLRESGDRPVPQIPATMLRFAVEEPLTLDPGMIVDDVSAMFAGQLFEGLVEVDADHNVLPAVAARWEVREDGTRYLFRLRQELRWNTGQRLTAADFEYAWKRNLALASRSPMAHLLYVVENARAFGEGTITDPGQVGVIALDDLTLEVRLARPTAYFPYLLAHPVTYPLPHWLEGSQEQPEIDPEIPVSNGAYQLVERRRGEKLVLGRNPFYRGHFPGNAEQVECPVFADYGPMLEAYADNDVDVLDLINSDPGTTALAQAAHGRELIFTPQPSTLFLAFRTDQPPFDDVRVRRALVQAVDREALAREAWQGQYLPGTGGFIPPGMPGHSPAIGLTYDTGQARRLLAQAGYPGGEGFPEITWLYTGSPDNPVVPALRNAWQEALGLRLMAQGLDWGEFMARRDRDPANLELGGWLADYPDPDSILRVVFHSTEGAGIGRWCSKRFDALVEEAARLTDHRRRMDLYRKADQILVREEVAVMPLGYTQGRVLVKPWVMMPRVPPVLMRLKHVVLQRLGGR